MNDEPPAGVLLSYAAGEQRYAQAICDIATANGLRVERDEDFQHPIWSADKTHRYRAIMALISRRYREQATASPQRRASVDRVLAQATEVIPVSVDQAWAGNLPLSAATLDLGTLGIQGVCEILLGRIRGSAAELRLPNGLHLPRLPTGTIPPHQLGPYLMDRLPAHDLALFGALICDDGCSALRHLFTDQVSWARLDQAAGRHCEIFAIQDIEQPVRDEENNVTGYESRLLSDYFGIQQTRLDYPTLALLLTQQNRVESCWLIPHHRGTEQETLDWLTGLLVTINDSLAAAGGAAVASATRWAPQLELRLLKSRYRLYQPSRSGTATNAIRELVYYAPPALAAGAAHAA